MSPFDQARYERQLGGLEAAEVLWSQLEFTGRLDAEYYRPSRIDVERKIVEKGGVPLSTLCDFVIGPFGSSFAVENYTDDQTYRYIRGKDVKPMSLTENDNVYMPQKDFERLRKYALRSGDVLVSVVGTLGNSALVEEQHLPAIFSCKSTAIRARNIDPRYLITYLNCEYGRNLLVRKERGAIQKGLNLDDLRTLTVYVAGKHLQQAIAATYMAAAGVRKTARDHLQKAEAYLLKALGLDTWQPPEALTYVRSSRDAFAAGRLDAEHFQESYCALQQVLTSQPMGYRLLGELALSLTNGAEIREYVDRGTPYLRVGDIKNLTVDENSVVHVDSALAEKEMDKVGLRVGDVLVSRSGSLAITAVIEPEWTHSLISSHLIRVRIADKKFDPYYVALFLASLPGRMQIVQWSNGGVQPEISQPSLSKIIVPCISDGGQAEIRRAIIRSRNARRRAAHLLDATKRAVEIGIETDEDAALDYLNQAREVHHDGNP